MKLGVAHEIGLASALSAALALVLMGGEVPAFLWIALAAPWVSCVLTLQGVSVPALSGTLLGLGGLTLGISTLLQAGLETSVLAFTELVIGLVVGRSLVRRAPGHDAQALGLSLLLILAGSVLNVGISFFVLFVLYAVCSVWALATSQLLAGAALTGDAVRTARARIDVVTPSFFVGTAVVAVVVLAAAGALFLAFPRVGLGDIGAFLKKKDRLPSSVGLRGDPRVLGGTTVVARVEGIDHDAFERGLYLRGVIYDQIDLDGFSQSDRAPGMRPGPIELADSGIRPSRYTVTASPAMGDHVLLLGSMRIARTLGGGAVNTGATVSIAGRTSHDELRTATSIDAPLRYEVLGGIAHAGEPPVAPRQPPADLDRATAQGARWFALPAGFDAQLAELARTAAGSDNDTLRQVEALRAFLLTKFQYGLDPPRFADRPLRAFLLEDRRGHCEFFASAFALLLRSRGIASRVVGGYQGGAWDSGFVVFQEKHAHAWVEWFLPGVGWVVDDATPMVSAPRQELAGVDALVERVRRLWDDKVLDYAFEDQLAALSRARRVTSQLSLRSLALGTVCALLVAAAVALLRRRAPRRRGDLMNGAPLGRAIAECVGRIAHQPVRACATLREAVASVPLGHPARGTVAQALDAYERSRFAGQPLAPAVMSAHIRALRRAPNQRQSPA